MKKSKESKKLKLNKSTISKLNEDDLNSIKGGTSTSVFSYTCIVPSHAGECLKCPWPRR